MKLNVLNLLPSISRLSGGIAPAVMGSVAEQRRFGVDARAVTLRDDYTEVDSKQYDVPYEAVARHWPRSFGYSKELCGQVLLQPQPDIIHSHGLWLYPGYAAMRLCDRLAVPSVVSPHGSLEPWAWQHRRWKKLPAWWLWERRRIQWAAALVATAEIEAVHMRQLGIQNAIAVIPLGLHLPIITERGAENSPRVALFVSRIHPVKGLLMLVEAVRRLRVTEWKFVIAGPSEDGHEQAVKAAVRAAGLDKYFSFPGPVHGPAKWQLYRSADLFLLPTYSENFGIVVAEALACEVPVLTTKGAPWQDLETHNCGWWTEPTVEGITQALAEATSTSTATLRAMGQRGRALVETKYTWRESARKTIALYQWLLGQEEKPSFVYTE